MDKTKKIKIKQSIHQICYGVKILTFCEALRYLFKGEYSFTFWGLTTTYLLLFVVLEIWEDKDSSVRMYPYADDEEEYYDENLEEEENNMQK